MSFEKTVNCDDPAPFEEDERLYFSNPHVELAPIDKIEQWFEQYFSTPFSIPSGVEFDNGILKQKKKVYQDEIFGLSVSTQNNGNADRGAGTLAGTAVGGAGLITIDGKQYLDLSGQVAGKYWTYDVANFQFGTVGVIRFKIRMPYAGTPTANRFWFKANSTANAANQLTMFHKNTGEIEYRIYNQFGNLAIAKKYTGWVPVADQEYEFEINHDFVTGALRLFIDGVQLGTTSTLTFDRGNIDTFTIGGEGTGSTDCYIRDFQVFSTVQHTEDFAGEIPRVLNNYQAAVVDLPTFNYVGAGSVQSFDGFLVTASDCLKFIMNGLYWSVDSWITSDGSQSNTAAEVLANIDSLPAGNTLDIKVLFPETMLLSSIDELKVEYTGQEYQTAPLEVLENQFMDGLVLISVVSVLPEGTDIKFATRHNGIDYWFNGITWVVSDLTPEQSNTIAEIMANADGFSLETSPADFQIVPILITDGVSTPELHSWTLKYNFKGKFSSAEKCAVWHYVLDAEGEPVPGAEVIIYPSEPFHHGDNTVIVGVKKIADEEGYVEFSLVETETIGKKMNMLIKYTDKFGQKREFEEKDFTVKNQTSSSIPNLVKEAA